MLPHALRFLLILAGIGGWFLGIPWFITQKGFPYDDYALNLTMWVIGAIGTVAVCLILLLLWRAST
jgi:hypothetical protein